MFAVMRDRGKQYTVQVGQTIDIDLMETSNEAKLQFNDVLLVAGGTGDGAGVKVGKPTVANAKVSATVVAAEVKADKLYVLKFRRRKDSKSKIGHRQRYTRIKVDAIES